MHLIGIFIAKSADLVVDQNNLFIFQIYYCKKYENACKNIGLSMYFLLLCEKYLYLVANINNHFNIFAMKQSIHTQNAYASIYMKNNNGHILILYIIFSIISKLQHIMGYNIVQKMYLKQNSIIVVSFCLQQ